jgi:ADP-ribosylation factor-like protein 2
MGLLSILKKVRQKEREMRILMVGLDNAGKTTIVKKFNGEAIDTIEPTLGFNIKTMDYRGYKLNIWDVGGQKTLRSYWRNYFEATDGMVWVVDSADRRRLGDCAEELQNLLVQEKLAGASLLVLANKQDLAGALTLKEIGETLRLDSITNRHWQIVSCSAVSGQGLVEGIDWIVSDVASRIYMLD